MTSKDLLFLLLLGVSVGLIVYCYYLSRRLEEFRSVSAEKQQQLKNAFFELRKQKGAGSAKTSARLKGGASGNKETRFTESLGFAQMQRRLKGGEADGGVPEKYRLLSALAGHGLNTAEISDILQLSRREAEQLVSLCQVGWIADEKKLKNM